MTVLTKSAAIRSLGEQGLPVAEIARRIGVRYQHARNVLLAAGMLTPRPGSQSRSESSKRAGAPSAKPPLPREVLVAAGFAHASQWLLTSEGELAPERPLPETAGVYGFVKKGFALYVGLANMGLARRLHLYARPGSTQRTSQRLNGLLIHELQTGSAIEILTATPASFEWNGLPVCGRSGLEAGLIARFHLPWNIRGARKARRLIED